MAALLSGAAWWALALGALLYGAALLPAAHALRLLAALLAPSVLLAGTPLDSLLDLRLLPVLAAALLAWVPAFLLLGGRVPVVAPLAFALACLAAVGVLLVLPALLPLVAGDIAPRAQAALLGACAILAGALAPFVRLPRRLAEPQE